ncbi:MAG: hypothetical protein HY975_01635, partial [Candidatus Kerfeldbacteria bacterium]|nr:hypothetical protein [Candidatus Kerfeldbacteria bacterium]
SPDTTHLVLTLPATLTVENLRRLAIRITPDSDVDSANVTAYLDGLRLATSYATPKPATTQTSVKTKKDLDKLVAFSREQYKSNEHPVVTIPKIEKKKFLFFNTSEVRWHLDQVELTDMSGVAQPAKYTAKDVPVGDSVEQALSLDTKALHPGKYVVRVTMSSSAGGVATIERDFLWGVLAVNVQRANPIVNLNEIVGIGVLDDQGKTICDAVVEANVDGPGFGSQQYSTKSKTITRSKVCVDKGVTNEPDYHFAFVPKKAGVYRLTVKAQTAAGTREYQENLEVAETVPFDIERSDYPTRIYPKALYDVRLTITPRQDFTGTVSEFVPASFDVSGTIPEAAVQADLEESSQQRIDWVVDWKKNMTYYLGYTFDAPDISPALFLTGPLTIGGNFLTGTEYQESRQWQIASDTISVAAVDATASAQSENVDGDGRKLVWTSDTVGYLFYTDGSTFVSYSKTTNAGMTWAAAVTLTARATDNFSIWYDQWTPGNTGGLIHVAFMETTGDDIYYENVNTASADAQKGEVLVVSRTTAHTALTDSVSITRASDGDVYIAYSSSTASSTSGVRYSTDVGTNWNDAAEEGLDDTSGDAVMLMPRPAGDIMLLRWDISAEDIQSKIYEDGGNSWDGAWTDIDTNAVDSTTLTETWSATLKPSTWHIFLAYVDNAGTTGSSVSDIRIADYSGLAWSAKANVYTDYDTISGVTIDLDTITNDLYVGYLRGLAAGPTVVQAYYKISRDDGTTWELERGNVVNFSGAFRGIMGNFASPYRVSVWAFDDTGADIWFGDLQDIGSHANALLVTNMEGFETQSSLTTAVAVTGTPTYSTSVYRSGAAAVRTDPSSSTEFVTHTLSYAATGKDALTNYDNFSSVFAMRVASGTTINQQTIIFSATDGTTVVAELSINADQTLSLTTGTDVNGSFALVDDTWYVIAFAYGIDNDVLRVGIFSSDMNTYHEAFEQSIVSATTMDRVRIGPQTASTTADLYFDDFMVYANSITRNFPLLRADYRINRMALDSTGTDTAWTNTYTAIDEVPTVVSDADYIESQAATAAETSNLQSASAAGISGNILAVRVTNMIWESSAATTSIQGIRVREGANIENTTAVDASGTAAAPINYSRVLTDEVNTTSLWDTTSLDALEVGVLTSTSETVFYRNGSSVVQVAFVPADTITISGTCNAFDQSTVCGDTGTVSVAVNGVLQAQTQ